MSFTSKSTNSSSGTTTTSSAVPVASTSPDAAVKDPESPSSGSEYETDDEADNASSNRCGDGHHTQDKGGIDCTNCDVCVTECPNDAISEGDEIYVIDPLKCTECVGAFDEPQCQMVCPADCIEPDPEFAETPEQLQAKYEQLHH